MIKKIFILIAILSLFSCSENELVGDFKDFRVSASEITGLENIDSTAIIPEAKQYFSNIAFMADWYAENPSFRQLNKPLSPSNAINSVALKLEEFPIIDSTGNKISFFDLNAEDRKSFLNTWQTVEAFELSQKLCIDSSRVSLGRLIKRNEAFVEAINNEKSASLMVSDPFWKVKSVIDKKEQEEISENLKKIESFEVQGLKSGEISDDDFWAAVVANRYLTFSIIQFAPCVLSPQTFVDHIRPSIKKGRIMVALPGGWTTHSLIIFYLNKIWFDVGHVAVLTKDSEEVADSIDEFSNISIGTCLSYDTDKEQLGRSWCYKHGFVSVCQVYDIQWKKVKGDNGKWRWKKEMTEVDGNSISNVAEGLPGTSYCPTLDTFFSKWVAPESFICSSLAWWCIKEGTGIDISDWWTPSIYPVDIFFSENIKIVDNTLE